LIYNLSVPSATPVTSPTRSPLNVVAFIVVAVNAPAPSRLTSRLGIFVVDDAFRVSHTDPSTLEVVYIPTLLVLDAIVHVSAFPIKSPVTLPVTSPSKSPVIFSIYAALKGLATVPQ